MYTKSRVNFRATQSYNPAEFQIYIMTDARAALIRKQKKSNLNKINFVLFVSAAIALLMSGIAIANRFTGDELSTTLRLCVHLTLLYGCHCAGKRFPPINSFAAVDRYIKGKN